jgi:acyl-CoA synthetase (AMP-forming)/AMP-acid ligase II
VQLPELDYPATVPGALHRAVREFGANEYLVMPDLRMTYAEIEAASRRVAKTLLSNGVGKGTRVGIHFTYGPEWLVTFFAVTRIGAICLPMSTAYVAAELRKSVRHGDVDMLIVPPTLFGEDHVAYVEAAFPDLGDAPELYLDSAPFLRSIWFVGGVDRPWARALSVDDEAALITDDFLELVEAEVAPGDWLMVVHTSGTTGEPKGVIHTHGSFVRHSQNLSDFAGVDQDYVQYSGLPWFWIGGVLVSIGQALAQGFKMVCLERFDEAAALDIIIAEKVSFVSVWPQLMQRFAQYAATAGRDTTGVPALAPPPPGTPRDPGLRHNSLGQTETMGPHTASGPERARILPEELRGSFGLPVPDVEHRIVDPETGEDMPPGVEGEVIVRGYSISTGLYKRERHEAFDDDGWLHTGDRGYFKDGYFFFTGRFNEMIKTLGSNVAPREVELALQACPEVGLAVVVGLPDPERGQVVAAALVPMPGSHIDVASVRKQVSGELSRYKVPRRLLVVRPEDLPMLPTGKPDMRAVFGLLEDDLEASRTPESGADGS